MDSREGVRLAGSKGVGSAGRRAPRGVVAVEARFGAIALALEGAGWAVGSLAVVDALQGDFAVSSYWVVAVIRRLARR